LDRDMIPLALRTAVTTGQDNEETQIWGKWNEHKNLTLGRRRSDHNVLDILLFRSGTHARVHWIIRASVATIFSTDGCILSLEQQRSGAVL
jgi:hypothetical protein